MSRRRLVSALLTGAGGFSLAGAADAQETRRRRGAEEPMADYERRTNTRRIDAIEGDGFRRGLQEQLRGARARAVLGDDAELQAALRDEGIMSIVRGDQHIRLGQARTAIRAIERYDPETARTLRRQLARFEPPRDRNVDERAGAGVGGLIGTVAGLAATRGRGGGTRAAVRRALGASALGATGAAVGATAQNASQGVLTDTDAGDIGRAAAIGGSVALGAAGARRAVRRALRHAAVKTEQRAAARPAVNQRLPYFEREAAERRADQTARRAARGMRTDDASVLTPSIQHMERVIELAGRGRRVSGRTSADKLRERVARAKNRGDFRAAAEALNREYASVMEDLGLPRGARIDFDAPEVVSARALKALEKRVKEALARRGEIQAEVAAIRNAAGVRAQINVLEARRGRLAPDEAYTLRLLRSRMDELASRTRTPTRRTPPPRDDGGRRRGETMH